MENPFENFRGVIQYVMIDKNHLDSEQRDLTIEKTLQCLEAIGWLYNCNKIQLELTTIPSEYLDK